MAADQPRPPENTRQDKRENDHKILYLVLFTLVVIGGLLIALVFGQKSLLTALPCLLGGAILILLPWFTLALIQKWRDRLEHQARSKGEATHTSGENQVKQ